MKGFNQKKGIEFKQFISLMVTMSSIQVVFDFATSLNLDVEKLDMKATFLHGNLEKEIYMQQLEDFKVQGKEHLVCQLSKNLIFHQVRLIKACKKNKVEICMQNRVRRPKTLLAPQKYEGGENPTPLKSKNCKFSCLPRQLPRP